MTTPTTTLTAETIARRQLAHARALIRLGNAESTGRLASVLAADIAYRLAQAGAVRADAD
jgi:hypothetical protein